MEEIGYTAVVIIALGIMYMIYTMFTKRYKKND